MAPGERGLNQRAIAGVQFLVIEEVTTIELEWLWKAGRRTIAGNPTSDSAMAALIALPNHRGSRI
jgi:hypothetical protein